MESGKSEGKRRLKYYEIEEEQEEEEDDQDEREEEEEEEEDELGFVVDYNKKMKRMGCSSKKGSGLVTVGVGVAAPAPACQADNCNADLLGSKRYHRRHKVCELHAKAPVVTVSGLHQRFCQQCSRFHGLEEFDDAKRSCRKRLAGHNQRRRKSSSDIH